MSENSTEDRPHHEHPPLPYPEELLDWAAINASPQIHDSAWVAQGAVVLGNVVLKARSSVWYGCVLRGDSECIEIGEETNVQDGSILHVDPGQPCVLGRRVTLGHRATVHAAVVEDDVMVAMGATVLSGCVIGTGALIAAGAVVMERTHVPPGTVWGGCPARKLCDMNDDLAARISHAHKHYVNNAVAFLKRYGRAHITALQHQPQAPPIPGT